VSALRHELGAVRAAAATALGEMKDPALVPLLTPLLNDSDTSASMAAATVLLKAGATDLEGLLRANRHDRVRAMAAERLRHHGRDAILLLTEHFPLEPSGLVRHAIMEGISYYLLSAAQLQEDDAERVRAVSLIAAGEDPDAEVRHYAVRTTARLNSRWPDETAQAHLRNYLRREKDRIVRCELIRSIFGTEATELLIEQLKDPDPAIRSEAAFYLGWHTYDETLFNERVVPVLIATLDDSDDSVVRNAAVALGHRGARQAKAALERVRNATTTVWLRQEIDGILRYW
jgi:HEAT repeat protein